MPFLPPNQQRQSTEGKAASFTFSQNDCCSQSKRKLVTQSFSDNKPEMGAELDDHKDKRSRLEEVTTPRSADSDSKPAAITTTSQKASPPARCSQCRQLIDDPDLRLFPGDPCDAVSFSFFSLLRN